MTIKVPQSDKRYIVTVWNSLSRNVATCFAVLDTETGKRVKTTFSRNEADEVAEQLNKEDKGGV